MAKKTITTTEYTDDLDGSKAERTVRFAFDGVQYEIDLNKKNQAALAKALKPYVDSARKVRGARSRKAATPSGRRTDLADVRAWAAANGLEVSERGRVSAAVLEAFDAAK